MRKLKYNEEQLATAIDDLLKLLEDDPRVDALIEKHECLDEINQFGPRGPLGIGLGRFGGHVVDD